MSDLNFDQICQDGMKKALDLGADSAEVYITRSKDLHIEVGNGKVETMKLAEEQGVGVRILKKQCLGYASTSDLSQSSLDRVITQALANSAVTVPEPQLTLPQPCHNYPNLDLYDPEINRVPIEEKIQLALDLEESARKYDSRVKNTQRCSYVDSTYEIHIANSLGVKGNYQGTYCGATGFLVAEENQDSQTGFSFQYSLRYQDLDPQKIAHEAAEKAVRMLGAKNISTGVMTTVFDPYVATSLLGLLSSSLSAEAVQKGKSRLAGKIGEEILSPLISIIDDGTMQDGIMSSPFDGEGVASQRTVLVDKGRLKSFLHNTHTAAKAGTSSTGNGGRSSYKSTPEISTTNLYIEKGSVSKELLINNVDEGIYITEVMGMHTANAITGDFSLGAAGLLIQKGKLAGPVRGIAIAGNIYDMFHAIDGVSSDLTFFVGKGSPTLKLSRMMISG